MQKRSVEKKTFPLCWTNTCCSHPNMVKINETEEIAEEPIRKALHRALIRELKMSIPDQNFHFMEKILYKKEGAVGSKFGEYEVDYVFLGKLESKVEYTPVPEEIDSLFWVEKEGMPNFIEKVVNEGGYFSPWFLKMYESKKLNTWWEMIEKNEMKDAEGENDCKVTNML